MLRVNPDDLNVFARGHQQVAGEVKTASKPDPGLAPSMSAGYGPVGAEFTAAVTAFQAAFFASGSRLSEHYDSHAGKILNASAKYVKADVSGAERVQNV